MTSPPHASPPDEHEGSGRARPDRVAVVVNGNARGVTDDLVHVLDQIVQTGDLFVSRTLEEGRYIATQIAERGYPTVLTGGGDGTFSLMATWILAECRARGREAPRFGLLRLGTGNALAWVLGAQKPEGRGMFADLTRLRGAAGSNTLGLIEVDGRLTPFAGAGVDGMALADFGRVKAAFEKVPLLRRRGTGALAYAVSIGGLSMPKVLLQPRARIRVINRGSEAVRLDDSGQPTGTPVPAGEALFEGEVRAVLMSTIPFWGFGARIFPFANERKDRFNLRTVDIGSVEVALHLRSIWDGSYRTPSVQDWLVDDVIIESEAPLPLEVAGDAAGSHHRIRARLYDEPVRVVDYYAPPSLDRGGDPPGNH